MPDESGEVLEEPNYPKLKEVVFDKSLEKAPFTVGFDEKKFTDLLRYLGVSEESIEGLTIKFEIPKRERSKSSEYATLGVYDSGKHIMTIYPDLYFELYREKMATAQQLIAGTTLPDKKLFVGLLTTKRLPQFLHELASPSDSVRKPDIERAQRVSQGLLEKALNKKLQETLHHESQHVADKDKLLLRAIQKGSLLLVGLPTSFALMEVTTQGIKLLAGERVSSTFLACAQCASFLSSITIAQMGHYFLVDIMERRARKTGRQLRNIPDFQNIVTIKPKEINNLSS